MPSRNSHFVASFTALFSCARASQRKHCVACCRLQKRQAPLSAGAGDLVADDCHRIGNRKLARARQLTVLVDRWPQGMAVYTVRNPAGITIFWMGRVAVGISGAYGQSLERCKALQFGVARKKTAASLDRFVITREVTPAELVRFCISDHWLRSVENCRE
jgi:hypothetical protein